MPLLDEEIFKVGYPVAFRPGGDTTREAFGKHIDEIKKIYGNLRALNQAAASAGSISSALQAHINSTNPHPNWKPKFSFSDITGDLDASRVKGKLTNATIDASNVNDLKSFVNNLIPTIPKDKGDGITDKSISSNGYATFNNGLMIQWGKSYATNKSDSETFKVVFPKKFPNACFSVSMTTRIDKHSGVADVWAELIDDSITQTEFGYLLQYVTDSYAGMGAFSGRIGVSYIAIGN